jgi:RNA polymerase sigma factor (sigma-70 family)
MDDTSERAARLAVYLGKLPDEMQGPLCGYVYGIVGDWNIACEIVLDTFEEACKAVVLQTTDWAVTGGEAQMRNWLYRVAGNKAISAGRHIEVKNRCARPVPLESLAESELSGRSKPFDDRVAEQEILVRALQEVEPDHVMCLLLHEVQGFSVQEIAEICDITPAAVQKRIRRAKNQLIRNAELQALRATRAMGVRQ